MTTAEAVARPAAAARPALPTPSRTQQFVALLRAEWTKLWSVRSTLWSLLVTIAIIVGLGALFCAARVARADHLDPGELTNFDPTGFSLNGIFLAQLAVGVLGVLVMSSEYATGQIRATFGATPQRNLVLAAKVAVFMVVVFVVGLVACFTAFFIGQAILGGSTRFNNASLGDPGALRAVIGGAMYLSVLGALGIGLGTILRRTAGAIAALVGLLAHPADPGELLAVAVEHRHLQIPPAPSRERRVPHREARQHRPVTSGSASPSSAPTPSHRWPSVLYSSHAAMPKRGMVGVAGEGGECDVPTFGGAGAFGISAVPGGPAGVFCFSFLGGGGGQTPFGLCVATSSRRTRWPSACPGGSTAARARA